MQCISTASTVTSLTVRIDRIRAQMLWSNACSAAGFDLEGRFEVFGEGEYVHDDDPMWQDGRLMWCETALEAMVLADYEAACGYRSQLLWDLASEEWNGSGYTVLSTRPLT